MPAQFGDLRPNLEFYRKLAKALLKAAQNGQPAAAERIARHAGESAAITPKLHFAQLTIAREQGFASWPRMRRFLGQISLDEIALRDAFVEAAVSDLRKAEDAGCPSTGCRRRFPLQPGIGRRAARTRKLNRIAHAGDFSGRAAELGAAAVRLFFPLRISANRPQRCIRRNGPHFAFLGRQSESRIHFRRLAR